MRSSSTRLARLTATGLTAAGLLTTGLTTVASPVSAAPEVSVRRLAGSDRYATAAAIARSACAEGGRVSVARGDAFPDALAAVNLGAPVLLTAAAALPPATADLLRLCGTGSATVLGTPDVVSTRVEQQLDGLVREVDRLGGVDRYGTAARTYYRTYTFESKTPRPVGGLRTGVLTSGEAFADAMTAGPVALGGQLPLLLTARDSLPRATRDALLHTGGSDTGIEQVLVVGGPAAVSERVVRAVEALGVRVRRIAGPDRASTAVEVFRFAERELGWRAEHVNLARGDAFADAVAAGPHVAQDRAPLLLTAGVDALGSATREFLVSRRATIRSIDVLGSRTAVSDAVAVEAARAATG